MAAILAVNVIAALRVAPAFETAAKTGKALLENEPWRGDFDGMVKDRMIRALVVYSKTFYFLDFPKLYDHWIPGRDAEPKHPRWPILRDVLGRVE